MQDGEKKINAQDTTQQILLIGEAGGDLDSSKTNNVNYKQCSNMLDGIALAGENSFNTILVVISSCKDQLTSALKTLRRVSTDSRIVLLADMAQEPLARRLSWSPQNPKNAADDYVILPTDLDRIVSGNGNAISVAPATPKVISETEKDLRIRELEKLATQDDLTGLKNRRYLMEFLAQIIQRGNREGFQVTLLLFDIDDFKQYNDQFGHPVGNNVLKQAAVMMKRCCRGHDIVGRIGGDEFAVIFWDRPGSVNGKADTDRSDNERRHATAEHPTNAYFMSERFRKELSSSDLSFLGAEGQGSLTISGGLATFPRDGKNAGELITQADRALLEAKRQGKNRLYIVGKG